VPTKPVLRPPWATYRLTHVEAMFTAIADRTTAIQIARQSDDPRIRATVTGARTTGPATMHRIRATLRKALNDAIRTRLIEFNPAAHVELPPGTRPKARVWTANAVHRWRETGQCPSPVMVWTPQQAGQFLDYAEDHDIVLYPLFVLILHRGLRRGEAVGLPDHAVDLDNALVAITRQLTTVGYQPIVKDVKTSAGDRVVPWTASPWPHCAPTTPAAPAGSSSAAQPGPTVDSSCLRWAGRCRCPGTGGCRPRRPGR